MKNKTYKCLKRPYTILPVASTLVEELVDWCERRYFLDYCCRLPNTSWLSLCFRRQCKMHKYVHTYRWRHVSRVQCSNQIAIESQILATKYTERMQPLAISTILWHYELVEASCPRAIFQKCVKCTIGVSFR